MTAHRMNLKDACASFGISYTFLYEAVKAGQVPAIKPARSYLVKPDDVEAWLVRVSDEKAEKEAADKGRVA